MKKSFTLPELSVAILIISVALLVFLVLSSNFIFNLVNAKKIFLLMQTNQSALEFLIAFRNKSLETTDFDSIQWFNNLGSGKYCLKINKTAGFVSSINLENSSQPCLFRFIFLNTPFKIFHYFDINIQNNFAYITSTSYMSDRILPKSDLSLILTNWHPLWR
jgi:type II secretory pathway pseudopilin PulG